jgi:hypothetical protein
MATSGEIVEHGSNRAGRWLHARRLRIALWIAVIEGILVAFHVIPWWLAVAAAAILVLFYFWAGRELRSNTARNVFWIAATSQALVALVPILVAVVGTLALIAVGILAILALVALFAEAKAR